jgi:hypothetical protein
MLLASSPTTQCTNFKPAFAMGNKLLNDDPLKGWGWLYNTPADGSSVADITYDIYADAELNDISKGWFVGKVKYSYDNANKKAIAKFFIENSVQVSYYTAYVSDSLA